MCCCCYCFGCWYELWKCCNYIQDRCYAPWSMLFDIIGFTSVLIDFGTTIYILCQLLIIGTNDSFVCCSNQSIDVCNPATNSNLTESNINVTENGFCHLINQDITCDFNLTQCANNVVIDVVGKNETSNMIDNLCSHDTRKSVLRYSFEVYTTVIIIKIICIVFNNIPSIIEFCLKYIRKPKMSQFTMDNKLIWRKYACCFGICRFMLYIYGPLIVFIILWLISSQNNVLSLGCRYIESNTKTGECDTITKECLIDYNLTENEIFNNSIANECNDYVPLSSDYTKCFDNLYLEVINPNISFVISSIVSIIAGILTGLLMCGHLRRCQLKCHKYVFQQCTSDKYRKQIKKEQEAKMMKTKNKNLKSRTRNDKTKQLMNENDNYKDDNNYNEQYQAYYQQLVCKDSSLDYSMYGGGSIANTLENTPQNSLDNANTVVDNNGNVVAVGKQKKNSKKNLDSVSEVGSGVSELSELSGLLKNGASKKE